MPWRRIGGMVGSALLLMLVFPVAAQERDPTELTEKQVSWVRGFCQGGLQEEPKPLRGTSESPIRIEPGQTWMGKLSARGSQRFEVPVQSGQRLELTLSSEDITEGRFSSPRGALDLIIPGVSAEPRDPIRESRGVSQTFLFEPEVDGLLEVRIESREGTTVAALLSIDDSSGGSAPELKSGAVQSGYIDPPGERDVLRLRFTEPGYLRLRVAMSGTLAISLHEVNRGVNPEDSIVYSSPGGASESVTEAELFVDKGEYLLVLRGALEDSLYYEVCQSWEPYREVEDLDGVELSLPAGGVQIRLLSVAADRRATLRLRPIRGDGRVVAELRSRGEAGLRRFVLMAEGDPMPQDLTAGNHTLELKNESEESLVVGLGVGTTPTVSTSSPWKALGCLIVGGLLGAGVFFLASLVPVSPFRGFAYGNSKLMDCLASLLLGALVGLAWIPSVRAAFDLVAPIESRGFSLDNLWIGGVLGLLANLAARGLQASFGHGGTEHE